MGSWAAYIAWRPCRDRLPLRVLVRPNADPSSVSLPGVSVVQGDVQDPISLGAAMNGVECVVRLIAVPIERGQQTFRGVNVEETRNVVSAGHPWVSSALSI